MKLAEGFTLRLQALGLQRRKRQLIPSFAPA
jgi:hypothetical protein